MAHHHRGHSVFTSCSIVVAQPGVSTVSSFKKLVLISWAWEEVGNKERFTWILDRWTISLSSAKSHLYAVTLEIYKILSGQYSWHHHYLL